MCSIYKKFIVAVILTILLIFIISPDVHADDASLGRTPDGVFPIQENDVVMESEEITVDLEKNSVECIFVFHNTGEAKDVLMGFPGRVEKDYEDSLTDPSRLEIKNFKAFVKGKQLKVTNEKNTENFDPDSSSNLKYSAWFTFDIHLNTDEKVTVRNTYNFIPTNYSNGDIATGYVLKTGALWKGPIGSAKVTFKLGKIQPYQIEYVEKGGFKYADNNIVWERREFEPEYDLSLIYNNVKYTKEFYEGEYATSEEKAAVQKKMNDYAYVKLLSTGGRTDELLRLYDSAIRENDYLPALYIRSFLPENSAPELRPMLGEIKVEKQETDYMVSNNIQFSGNAFIDMSISHFENGKEVFDIEHGGLSYFGFVPGVEYNIKYTLTDWEGNTQQKVMKFKVPEEQPTASSPVSVEPVSVAEQSAAPDPADNDQVPDTGPDSVKGVWEEGHSTNTVPFLILCGGIIILGIVITAIMYKGRDKSK